MARASTALLPGSRVSKDRDHAANNHERREYRSDRTRPSPSPVEELDAAFPKALEYEFDHVRHGDTLQVRTRKCNLSWIRTPTDLCHCA